MGMREVSGERFELTGTSLTTGIAVGKAYRFKQIDLESLKGNRFAVEDLQLESRRLDKSIDKSREQLSGLLRSSLESGKQEAADIFAAHIQLLEDEAFLETIRNELREQRLNVEYILSVKISEVERSFESMDNEIVRTRLYDIQDVYQRLLRNLLEIEHVRVTPLIKPRSHPILVAERLLPSDVALLEFRKIEGIIMEEGSAVSHVAILTRSFGIPAIMNVPGAATLIRSDSSIILDSYSGKIIVNPSETETVYYRRRRRTLGGPDHTTEAKPCLTRDGVRVKLEANANTPIDVSEAIRHGAEGIGLVRSEIFYLAHGSMPTQHEEYAFLQSLYAAAENRATTIRLLDIGADKSPSYLQMEPESNPQLGLRGIRYLLAHASFMRQHLTGIIRAARDAGTTARILLPFVSLPREVEASAELLREICAEEEVERSSVKLGIMVEVPSVVWSLPAFAGHIDFLSVGTNDLVQFTFAASREDQRLDRYRRESLPVTLRILRTISAYGHARNIEVSVCGELASDPSIAVLMVGLGIRQFSVQPTALELVRKSIESTTLGQAAEMVQEVLQFSDGDGFPLAKAG